MCAVAGFTAVAALICCRLHQGIFRTRMRYQRRRVGSRRSLRPGSKSSLPRMLRFVTASFLKCGVRPYLAYTIPFAFEGTAICRCGRVAVSRKPKAWWGAAAKISRLASLPCAAVFASRTCRSSSKNASLPTRTSVRWQSSSCHRIRGRHTTSGAPSTSKSCFEARSTVSTYAMFGSRGESRLRYPIVCSVQLFPRESSVWVRATEPLHVCGSPADL